MDEKQFDMVTLGEILIDFTPDGFNELGFPRYIRNPGGAVFNAAVTMAKYGAKTAFLGKVGDDLFGRFLRDYLTSSGVDCRGLCADAGRNTTLAFVSLEPNGERDFAFYRRHEADLKLREDELDLDRIRSAKLFHFGSLSLCAEPARQATWTAVREAKSAGALVSYDPNYRESLWAGEDFGTLAAEAMRQADLVKVSEEEGEMLTGLSDPMGIAREIVRQGPRFAAVTMGGRGSCYATSSASGYAEPFPVNPIDTTGAGDVFFGTFLYEFITKSISFDDGEQLMTAMRRANKAAALCTTKKGGAPSVPDYAEI